MSRAGRWRGVAFLGVFAALAAVLAVSAWWFVQPTSVRGEVRLAPIEDFALGSVTPFRIDDGRLLELRELFTYFGSSSHGAPSSIDGDSLVYVVRLPDGDFRVLSGRSTHLGQVIEWKPDFVPEVGNVRGVFFGWGTCPLWAVDGTRIFGPAPRDMDFYRWEIDDGVLVVDISERHEGEVRGGPEASRVTHPPYDVLSEGWATSGWPAAAGD